MMTGLFWRKNSEILEGFALSEGLLLWSPFYRTETLVFFRCKEKSVVFDLGKGGKAVAYVYYLSMAQAKQIDIFVSFLMESGVRMLLKDLKAALDRGVRIRILTENYLGITQPSALFLIKKELGDTVELRFYNDKERSFHPKSYIPL